MTREPPRTPSIHVRLPAALHEQVVAIAGLEGSSLNTYITLLVARATANYPLPRHDGKAVKPKRKSATIHLVGDGDESVLPASGGSLGFGDQR